MAFEMGILSSAASVTRYQVQGELEKPVHENLVTGLKKDMIRDIDGEPEEKAVGWTSFEKSLRPDFDGVNFSIGSYLVFSLRIDKKSIPPKVINKLYAERMEKRLKETGRDYLSRHEKVELKEEIVNLLAVRIPATPSVYDLVWDHENRLIYFFTTQKAANEQLETLFFKTFNISLIRLFPFTMADLKAGLSPSERDDLLNTSPTNLRE